MAFSRRGPNKKQVKFRSIQRRNYDLLSDVTTDEKHRKYGNEIWLCNLEGAKKSVHTLTVFQETAESVADHGNFHAKSYT